MLLPCFSSLFAVSFSGALVNFVISGMMMIGRLVGLMVFGDVGSCRVCGAALHYVSR